MNEIAAPLTGSQRHGKPFTAEIGPVLGPGTTENDRITPVRRWWDAERHAARRPTLLARNRIKAAMREHFATAGFTEVECAQLQRSPGNEVHLHGLKVEAVSAAGDKAALYLHTSPEFASKKLLAAGETRIFDFARVFRNRETGRLHAREFTMLEWYRAGEPYQSLMADCADLLRLAADAGGQAVWSFGGRAIDPKLEPERMTLAEAFKRFAGIDLLSTLDPAATDREALAKRAAEAGIRVAADDTWSDVFTRVLIEKVEPAIGNGRGTILCEYPWPEAALSRRKPDDPLVAERFELYACGVELANAFGELTDAAEQHRRFAADMALKQAIYGESAPIDEDLLSAIASMPETSGAALGFDRLVMLATGAGSVEEVLWTPPHEPFGDQR
jgi:elongation factor P--(R)-beta-lysine ligase